MYIQWSSSFVFLDKFEHFFSRWKFDIGMDQ